MSMVSKKKNSYYVLLTNFLCFLIITLAAVLLSRNLFVGPTFEEIKIFAFAVPLTIFLLISTGMYVYIERKYNNFSFKNIFIYLGIVLFFTTLISTFVIPNSIELPFGKTYSISWQERLYGIMFGFGLLLLVSGIFGILPRKLISSKWLKIIAYIFIILTWFFILVGLVKDRNSYLETFKSGFSNIVPVISLCGHQNVFGRILITGVFSVILLDIVSNKHLWLLMLIPFSVQAVFVYSKIAIVIITVIIAFYLIVLLVKYMQKGTFPLYLLLLIIAFFAIMIVTVIVFTVYSNSGLLFKIKNIFINAGNAAKNTFESRMRIWRSVIKLLNLSPVFWIFGFGGANFGTILNITYESDPEWSDMRGISSAHNAALEMLGRGGIIFLIINILLIGYVLYAIKDIYKKNKTLGITFFVGVLILLLDGIVESNFLIVEGDSIIFTIAFIVPILICYSNQKDKEIAEMKKCILNHKEKLSNNIFVNANNLYLRLEKENIKDDKINDLFN